MPFTISKPEKCNMKEETVVEGHVPSMLPSDKKWRLVWNDE